MGRHRRPAAIVRLKISPKFRPPRAFPRPTSFSATCFPKVFLTCLVLRKPLSKNTPSPERKTHYQLALGYKQRACKLARLSASLCTFYSRRNVVEELSSEENTFIWTFIRPNRPRVGHPSAEVALRFPSPRCGISDRTILTRLCGVISFGFVTRGCTLSRIRKFSGVQARCIANTSISFYCA